MGGTEWEGMGWGRGSVERAELLDKGTISKVIRLEGSIALSL